MITSYWIFTIIVMLTTITGYFILAGVKRHYISQTIPLIIRVLLFPLVVTFILLDWFMNILITIPMLDLPDDPLELVTHRMKRYKLLGSKRKSRVSRINRLRYKFAVIICNLLSRGERGHC